MKRIIAVIIPILIAAALISSTSIIPMSLVQAQAQEQTQAQAQTSHLPQVNQTANSSIQIAPGAY